MPFLMVWQRGECCWLSAWGCARRSQAVMRPAALVALVAGVTVLLGQYCLAQAPAAPATPYRVGAAKVDITPDFPVRLTGYSERRTEATRAADPLFARALVIDDSPQQAAAGAGGANATGANFGPALVITLDTCGVPTEFVAEVRQHLAKNGGIRAERLVVAATHSHTAPQFPGFAPALFAAPLLAAETEHTMDYKKRVLLKLDELVAAALRNREPATLEWGEGKVNFALNRRAARGLRKDLFADEDQAPVDRSLPFIVARGASGRPLAVWANYACHATTLTGAFNEMSGDWPGLAAAQIERDFADCTALITIGCGADANPHPRGEYQQAQRHGEELAREVQRVVGQKLTPLTGPVRCQLREIALPLARAPAREEFERRAQGTGAEANHARYVLARAKESGRFPEAIPLPVGVWTIGNDLALVFLGGEVVVDYTILLKTELATEKLWVTAYANGVPGYIASRRVLREGGYEADFSMLFYGWPTRLADGTEDLVCDEVQRQLPPQFYAADLQREIPPPLSPSASLATFKVSADFKVELAAAEPLVADPVAFDWLPDGRLAVLEMGDYPLGPGGLGEPGGRVKLLSDTNGDGRYESATLFADAGRFPTVLNFPTAIKAWRKGVLVCAAPHITYFADENGDGTAEQFEILATGFSEGNQQHRVNGLRWSFDNWLYLANGDSGGRVRSPRRPGECEIRGRDLRFRPATGELETQSGQSQFGRDCDDWGNWFGGNNSQPLWHFVLDEHYLRRNLHFVPPSPRREITDPPGAAPVFPISRTLARFNEFHRANTFTSACGPTIYRDSWLGEGLAGNAFVCEPVHNLVHREVLQSEGFSFSGRRAPGEQQSEFLAAADNWFRPVMVRTGPDGALWIADMYRFVIEHPQWIPEAWQRKLDLRAGSDRGRIYRVVPAHGKRREVPRLSELETAALVEALESPNGPVRDMAQQLLVERANKEAIPLLQRAARSAANPLARLHALGALDGLQGLSPEIVVAALGDSHSGVRRFALRLAERYLPMDLPPAVGDAVLVRADDNNAFVQIQLAYTLGELRRPAAGTALARLALQHADDPSLVAAVLSSCAAHNVGELVREVLAKGEGGPLIEQVLQQAVAHDQHVALAPALEAITSAPQNRYAAWQLNALAGIAEVAERRKGSLRGLLGEPQFARLAPLLEYARQQLRGSAEPALLPERLAAVRLVACAADEPEANLGLLAGLLRPQEPLELQFAAVSALGRSAAPQAPLEILLRWPHSTPELRTSIVEAFLARPDWHEGLILALEKGQIAPAQLENRHRQRLISLSNGVLRERALALLAPRGENSARGEIVKNYAAALQLPGSAERGQALFAKHCAACHKLGEVGHAVGPDLAAAAAKPGEALLEAILDPNRAVDERYLTYIAATVEGQVMSGMLLAESASGLTLALADGKQAPVLRSELESLKNTGLSFMPEGYERDLTPAAIADLLAFVRGFAPPSKSFPWNKPDVVRVTSENKLALEAATARIYGDTLVMEEKYRNLGYWQSENDLALWNVEVPAAGRYQVVLGYACDNAAAGNRFVLAAAGQRLSGVVAGTGSWSEYRPFEAGFLELPAGPCEVSLASAGPVRAALLDLRTIHLIPAK